MYHLHNVEYAYVLNVQKTVFFSCLQVCCLLDLCLDCKERHYNDLLTKDHQIAIYRKISDYFGNEYACRKHPPKYCELPVMNSCTNDEAHDTIDIKEVYKAKRRQHRNFISMLKSDVLFNRNILFFGD